MIYQVRRVSDSIIVYETDDMSIAIRDADRRRMENPGQHYMVLSLQKVYCTKKEPKE